MSKSEMEPLEGKAVSDCGHIHSEADIIMVLASVRSMMLDQAFSEIDVQKVLVGISELTRNVLNHANQLGTIRWIIDSDRIEIYVHDQGPGISNLNQVLTNGQRPPNAKGLGLGLSGTKRLMDEFRIESSERGTKIHVIKRKTGSISGR